MTGPTASPWTGEGNVYVAGESAASWGSPVRSYTALEDALVAKLARSPTGVEVSSLAARALSSGVEMGWGTASELSITGFNVWRAQGDDEDWAKVNGTRIAAEGGSWGNQYRYVDSTARPGRRYQYRLEALTLLGGSEWYGPVWGRGGWSVFLPLIWR